MTKEEIRKIADEAFKENVMTNLDSAVIFMYIKGLEERWDALKKWLEENDYQYYDYSDSLHTAHVLEKMKELEGKNGTK